MSDLDLYSTLKAMSDFTESMERIRTMAVTTPEQWDELAQGILAMADSPEVERTEEAE